MIGGEKALQGPDGKRDVSRKFVRENIYNDTDQLEQTRLRFGVEAREVRMSSWPG